MVLYTSSLVPNVPFFIISNYWGILQYNKIIFIALKLFNTSTSSNCRLVISSTYQPGRKGYAAFCEANKIIFIRPSILVLYI